MPPRRNVFAARAAAQSRTATPSTSASASPSPGPSGLAAKAAHSSAVEAVASLPTEPMDLDRHSNDGQGNVQVEASIERSLQSAADQAYRSKSKGKGKALPDAASALRSEGDAHASNDVLAPVHDIEVCSPLFAPVKHSVLTCNRTNGRCYLPSSKPKVSSSSTSTLSTFSWTSSSKQSFEQTRESLRTSIQTFSSSTQTFKSAPQNVPTTMPSTRASLLRNAACAT